MYFIIIIKYYYLYLLLFIIIMIYYYLLLLLLTSRVTHCVARQHAASVSAGTLMACSCISRSTGGRDISFRLIGEYLHHKRVIEILTPVNHRRVIERLTPVNHRSVIETDTCQSQVQHCMASICYLTFSLIKRSSTAISKSREKFQILKRRTKVGILWYNRNTLKFLKFKNWSMWHYLKLKFRKYPSIHTNYVVSHCTTLQNNIGHGTKAETNF